MCTVTWIRNRQDGYVLCFSRDEKLTRNRAEAPVLRRTEGVSYLSPTDGDHGGSWLASNEFGLTVCLVNRYDAPAANTPAPLTRGDVVLALAPSATTTEAEQRLRSLGLQNYRPFRLSVVTPDANATIYDWAGTALTTDADGDAQLPIISSSLAQAEAQTARLALYQAQQQRGQTADGLVEFHASHEPARGPLSPCMHRADAATVSLTTVEVSLLSVRMFYRDGPPCEPHPVATSRLLRREGRGVRAA
jgi:hypothetical protein